MPLNSVRAALRLVLLGSALLAALLPGCRSKLHAPPADPAAGSRADAALFSNVAARAGVHFTHTNGASGKFYYIEITSAGCAFFDYDNDGYLDILLIQSGPPGPATPGRARPHCALYHNNGDGTFTDVTAGSGLDKDLGCAQGVAVGDYDNDGYDDLFLTSYPHNFLFHNERGSGKFTDVTHKMGMDRPHSTGYATSAAFGDYDNDGRLDLCVCYYAPWTPSRDKPCQSPQGSQDYCSPQIYDLDTPQLWHNEGSRFTDVTHKAGLDTAKGRGLAVAFLDYNGDNRQDILIANDITPNMLWRNNGDGTFTNDAARAGVAYAEGGALMAGMGIGLADYDHSGRESLFLSNFSGQPKTLFKNAGRGLFEDVSTVSGLSLPQMNFLSFGCEFLDYDADGWPDLIVANGHVQVHIAEMSAATTYAERKQLFHNGGHGTFQEVSDPAALGDLALPTVARGLAVGDYDNDGRPDVLVNNQNAPAQLFHNRDRSSNHWVSFLTAGVKSNRDGYGAVLTLTAGGMRQVAGVRAGSSYLSHSDRRVYFGLGRAPKTDRVEVRWPSGTRDLLPPLPADMIYTVTEGKGVTARRRPGPRHP